MTREGFAWALAHRCPSHPDPGMRHEEWEQRKSRSPVRIQCDPERDQPLPHRAIQIGLSQEAVQLYVSEWIRRITDVTSLAHRIHALVCADDLSTASDLLPDEAVYSIALSA